MTYLLIAATAVLGVLVGRSSAPTKYVVNSMAYAEPPMSSGIGPFDVVDGPLIEGVDYIQ
jgi:hypothetical protein